MNSNLIKTASFSPPPPHRKYSIFISHAQTLFGHRDYETESSLEEKSRIYGCIIIGHYHNIICTRDAGNSNMDFKIKLVQDIL